MGKMVVVAIVGGVVAAGAGAFFLMHKSAQAAPNQPAPQSLVTKAAAPVPVAVAAPAPRVTTTATLTQAQKNAAQAAVLLQEAASLRNLAISMGPAYPQNPQYSTILNLSNQASAFEAQAKALGA